MSDIVKQNSTAMLTKEDIQTLVLSGIIPQGTPEPSIKLFARYCSESQLSPFKKQVHLVKRWTKDGDRYTIQTGIDGYRAIADRTGRYAGNDDPVFDDEKKPMKATVTVYKLVGGIRCPFTATARWEQYYPGEKQGFMWNKMPHLMLGKCAEALALRKAFPDELSGVYTDEEMHQADANIQTIPQHQVVPVVTNIPAQIHQHIPEPASVTKIPPPEIAVEQYNNSTAEEPVEEVPPIFNAAKAAEILEAEEAPKQLKNENYVIPFGVHKGKKLRDMKKEELKRTVNWINTKANGKYADVSRAITEFINDDGLPF